MKKWSYVTAMMLAVSTGCVFTGCINNDEPYGIEQIRLATAKFLESKKAAAEAEASANAIAAETEKIKQETEKIKQEVEKIKAKLLLKQTDFGLRLKLPRLRLKLL